MNNANSDYYDIGLKDAKEHLDHVAYKLSRYKSLDNPPMALKAALENEANLAENHLSLLQKIKEIGGDLEMIMLKSIILGKIKVRYDRIVELDRSKDHPDKIAKIKEMVMNEIIDLGSKLRAVG